MIQPTTDPSQDPEVRRRLMQQLAQPTTTDPAAAPVAPAATPASPTFAPPATRSPTTGFAGGQTAPTLSVTPPAAPQAPATPQTPATPTSFGNATYDAIAAEFRKYDVTPTIDKVSQWGTNVDPNYMQAISQKIAEQFGKGGPQSGPNGTTPTATTTPTPTIAGNYSDSAFQQALQGLPANGDSVRQVLAAHPEWGITALSDKGDKVRLADGRVIDVGYAFGSGQGSRWQWLDTANAGGGGAPVAGSASNPWLDEMRQQLRSRMATDQTPVDENVPQIAQALSAARLEGGRSMDTERKALAERLYAQGGGDVSGNELSQGIQQSAERNATGMSQLRANLIMTEYQARRSDLNDAMQQALASGDAQMAREVQMSLAQLDATLRREGYGVNMAQFAQLQNNNSTNKAAGA